MVYTRVWQLGFEQQGGKRRGGRWAYLGGHSSPLKGRPAKGERGKRLHRNTCSPPDLPGDLARVPRWRHRVPEPPRRRAPGLGTFPRRCRAAPRGRVVPVVSPGRGAGAERCLSPAAGTGGRGGADGVRACGADGVREPGSSCSAAAAQRNEERSWGADTRAHPISESKEKGGTWGNNGLCF